MASVMFFQSLPFVSTLRDAAGNADRSPKRRSIYESFFSGRIVGIPYKTLMSRQLKVKDENLAPIQEVAILRLLGVKSVHFGGQSPGTRLTKPTRTAK